MGKTRAKIFNSRKTKIQFGHKIEDNIVGPTDCLLNVHIKNRTLIEIHTKI